MTTHTDIVTALATYHATNAAVVGTMRGTPPLAQRVKGYAGGIAARDARRVATTDEPIRWQSHHAYAIVAEVRAMLADHPHPVKVRANLSHRGAGWLIEVDLAE